MSSRIYIRNEIAGTVAPLDPRDIRDAVSFTLEAENVDAPCLIGVTVTDDAGIREINRAHRDIDAATDVLSFPLQTFSPGKFKRKDAEFDHSTNSIPLGDVVLSAQTVKRQAAEYGNTVSRETTYLTVHSVLHLLGYDHENETDKRVMRTREKHIMERLGYGEDALN